MIAAEAANQKSVALSDHTNEPTSSFDSSPLRTPRRASELVVTKLRAVSSSVNLNVHRVGQKLGHHKHSEELSAKVWMPFEGKSVEELLQVGGYGSMKLDDDFGATAYLVPASIAALGNVIYKWRKSICMADKIRYELTRR